jgi:putative Holliday junction resolvase
MSAACLVGIDFGERRIGVAVSDTEKKLAFSLDVIHRESGSYGLKKLKKLLEDRVVDAFVVGLPYRDNGTLGSGGEEILKYTQILGEYFGVDVITWDERYTTVFAEQTLIDANVKREERRHIVDKVAAQCILQSYIDHLHES